MVAKRMKMLFMYETKCYVKKIKSEYDNLPICNKGKTHIYLIMYTERTLGISPRNSYKYLPIGRGSCWLEKDFY